MIVSIHQPNYIPWIGFYYKMAHSDVFVYLDDVQYSNKAAHNFNVIKTPQGEFRLKIPVEYSFGDEINDVRTKDELRWKSKHLRTLQMNYSKADFFNEIFPAYCEIINQDFNNIAELNMAINKYVCDGFGIHPKIIKSSELGVSSKREERVIEICSKVGADEYLSGNGARAYQIDEHFRKRGIRLTYLDYKPIYYKQLWGNFLPNMSVIDFIFNKGFNWKYVEESIRGMNIWK